MFHIFMPLPFSLGEHLVSPLSIRMYVRPVRPSRPSICPPVLSVRQFIRPVHNKNGFCSISVEKISVLDSNFIHRYNVGQFRLRVKSTNYYWSYGPFSTLKNGFRSISFEKICALDSYFINGYVIIKYISGSI